MASNGTNVLPPETPAQLIADGINLIGATTVCGTFYGFMTAIAGVCIYTFCLPGSRAKRSRGRLAFLVSYVALLWLCGSLYVAGIARSTTDAYVDRRLVLQSPAEWGDPTLPEVTVLDTAYEVSMALADGLMVWRFRTVWYDSPWYPFLMPVPVLIYLASLATGFTSVVSGTRPDRDFYSLVAQRTTVPAFILSVALNLYTTSLIAGRLYSYRRWFAKHIGNSALHPKHYTNIAGIVVESCALFTVTSIIFVCFYLLHNPGQFLMIAVLAEVQIIAPLLVMLRISNDVAWEVNTATTVDHRASTRQGCVIRGPHETEMTDLRFAKEDGDVEYGTEESRTVV
ncbi:hypothetical protein CONPUDRAFT_145251 [Coniophora puteana RWD-64-598 SS2]|uniref:Family A G protein-coupled receptor-like protein n=1 Tax=Coniophora puteana (strain RWD-64-598) TaxID=741705 RepID=A0A5M3MIK9_CONPW|nr:uncharacterized protein CONPUDRAFT_145251 [Coniophora puteana RWD-64-598 SS2]EIW79079.1 hypothetical protein CONPUDRAFT_145251 [Coniophora puteana RWD-64-598 SS2]